jgi:hypothetical protein
VYRGYARVSTRSTLGSYGKAIDRRMQILTTEVLLNHSLWGGADTVDMLENKIVLSESSCVHFIQKFTAPSKTWSSAMIRSRLLFMCEKPLYSAHPTERLS